MVKGIILNSLVALFVGAKDWGQVQAIVHIVDSTALKGSEKRALVVEKLEEIGFALCGWLLNLAIELAVAKLRLK